MLVSIRRTVLSLGFLRALQWDIPKIGFNSIEFARLVGVVGALRFSLLGNCCNVALMNIL